MAIMGRSKIVSKKEANGEDRKYVQSEIKSDLMKLWNWNLSKNEAILEAKVDILYEIIVEVFLTLNVWSFFVFLDQFINMSILIFLVRYKFPAKSAPSTPNYCKNLLRAFKTPKWRDIYWSDKFLNLRLALGKGNWKWIG